MQRSKQRDGSDPFAMPDEPLKLKPVLRDLPDVHESMRLAGIQDLRNDPRQRGRRLLCCCGERGCGIGPMTEMTEEEETS